jgi:hypothetical protein
LARELADKGEKKTVIEYLQLCSKFWEGKTQLLQRWISEIEQGHVPDFTTVG